MDTSDAATPGAALHDMGRHAFFGALGGTVLALLAVLGLESWKGAIPFLVVAVIGGLVVGCAALMRSAANRVSESPARFASVRGQYLTITRLEYGGFAVAVFVVGDLLNQGQFVVPLCVIVAGLHYGAIGTLFRRSSPYQTWTSYLRGGLLCAIAIATMLALPAQTHLGPPVSGPVIVWALVAGLASALVLWVDALVALLRGLRLSRAGATSAGLAVTHVSASERRR